MKKEPCNHEGTCFTNTKSEEAKGYRKYVGKLRKCKKCGWYIGDKSLKFTNPNVYMEEFINWTVKNGYQNTRNNIPKS